MAKYGLTRATSSGSISISKLAGNRRDTAAYNSTAGLAVCFSMTSKAERYPFEVPVQPNGVVLAEIRNRVAELVGV